MTDSAKSAAQTADNIRVLDILARTGFAVLGLLHIFIGAIAIGLVGGSGESADQSSALRELSSKPGGIFVIWAVAYGAVGATALTFALGGSSSSSDSSQSLSAKLARSCAARARWVRL